MSTIEKLPTSGSPFATIRTEDSADGAEIGRAHV